MMRCHPSPCGTGSRSEFARSPARSSRPVCCDGDFFGPPQNVFLHSPSPICQTLLAPHARCAAVCRVEQTCAARFLLNPDCLKARSCAFFLCIRIDLIMRCLVVADLHYSL